MKAQHVRRLAGIGMAVGILSWGITASATSINAMNYHAYGANIGWINARGDVVSGAVIGQFYSTGYLYGANVGWISLGSGMPANGYEYANNSAGDWGVNHNGSGGLRGLAYGANIGWINFEDTGDPRVDLMTGKLSGYAYSANVGWISLSNNQAYVETAYLDWGPDTDGDGIPDAWEYMMVGDLTTLGPYPADADNNGFPDLYEFYADTNPTNPASKLVITDLDLSTPTNVVTWTIQPTRLYRVEMADAMTNNAVWVDSGYGVITPDPAATMTLDVVNTNDMQFFRARAIVPLAP